MILEWSVIVPSQVLFPLTAMLSSYLVYCCICALLFTWPCALKNLGITLGTILKMRQSAQEICFRKFTWKKKVVVKGTNPFQVLTMPETQSNLVKHALSYKLYYREPDHRT